jgi:hypothetical protein
MVQPETEIEDIRAHLREFLNEEKRFHSMGLRGRESLLSQHSPAVFASAIVTIAEQSRGFSSSAAWLRAADRIGDEISTFLPGQCPTFADRVINEIACLATPPISQTAERHDYVHNQS